MVDSFRALIGASFLVCFCQVAHTEESDWQYRQTGLFGGSGGGDKATTYRLETKALTKTTYNGNTYEFSLLVVCRNYDDPSYRANFYMFLGEGPHYFSTLTITLDDGPAFVISDATGSDSGQAIGYWENKTTIPFLEKFFNARRATFEFNPLESKQKYWNNRKKADPYIKIPEEIQSSSDVRVTFPVAGLKAPLTHLLTNCGLDY